MHSQCGWLGTGWPCTSQPKQALGCLARSKGCGVLGKVGVVGAVIPLRRGVTAATSRPLRLEGIDLGLPRHRCQGDRGRGSGRRTGHGGGGRGCPAIGSRQPQRGSAKRGLRPGRGGSCGDVAGAGQTRGRGHRWKSSDGYGPRVAAGMSSLARIASSDASEVAFADAIQRHF